MFVVNRWQEESGCCGMDWAIREIIGPFDTEEAAENVRSELEEHFPRLHFDVARLMRPTQLLASFREHQEGRCGCHSPEIPELLDEETARAVEYGEDCERVIWLAKRAKELRENEVNAQNARSTD